MSKNYFGEVSAVEARKESNISFQKILEAQKERLAYDIISAIKTNCSFGNFGLRLVIKDESIIAMRALTNPLRERGFDVSFLRILKNPEDEKNYRYSLYRPREDDDEYASDENHMLVVTW